MRALVAFAALTAPTLASAHIGLLEPTVRYEDNKNAPCGAVNDARTTNVTTFAPGQTIQVVFDEYVKHPGYYRIAFDPDGQDDLGPPEEAGGPNPANVLVLADEIPDQAADPYVVEVTLPDVTCDDCTLQVIQVMLDKPPWGDGNDIYYQCADLILSADATTAPGTTAPGTTDTGPTAPTDTAPQTPATADTAAPAQVTVDGGCGCASAPAGYGWSVVPLLLALRRRR